MKYSDLEKLEPITVRIPPKLRDDLLYYAEKERRSLSSYCRILIEDNYKNFRRNHRYHSLKFKNENFVPLSFTMTLRLKKQIIAYISTFRRNYYSEITFSIFIRKVLSDTKKE